jgi:drug/metabolite transporter (DMT)-like permease
MVSWTAFAIFNSAWLKRHPEVNATDWANWLGVATGLGAVVLVAGGGHIRDAAAGRQRRAAFMLLCTATGLGSAWLATILWNIASQRLSASLCGQLIVSETLFALLYSFAWDGQWPAPGAMQRPACCSRWASWHPSRHTDED